MAHILALDTRWLVLTLLTLLGLTVATVLIFILFSRPAHADVCQGSIPKETGTNGQTFPYGHYTDWTIDGEGWDLEYVFTFAPTWAVDHNRFRWDTTSKSIHDMAGWRWGYNLYSPQSCASPVLIYADAAAVELSGGPLHWESHMWLWYK